MSLLAPDCACVGATLGVEGSLSSRRWTHALVAFLVRLIIELISIPGE